MDISCFIVIAQKIHDRLIVVCHAVLYTSTELKRLRLKVNYLNVPI